MSVPASTVRSMEITTAQTGVQTSLSDLGTPLVDVTFVVVDLETTGGRPEAEGHGAGQDPGRNGGAPAGLRESGAMERRTAIHDTLEVAASATRASGGAGPVTGPTARVPPVTGPATTAAAAS